MNGHKVLNQLQFEIDKEKVFAQLHCTPDSPSYEAMEETYQEILPEICRLCSPRGLLCRGTVPASCRVDGGDQDMDAVFLLLTIGQEVSDYSTQAFAEGDYVKGLMSDAMADAALFSLEAGSQRELRDACRGWKIGIARRLEAPQDLSMEIQKEALLQTEADKFLGLTITEGYMYRPLKTSCNVFVTTCDTSVFRSGHNCRKCPNLTCSFRSVQPVQVTIQKGGFSGNSLPETVAVFTTTDGILDGLHTHGISLRADCGGAGRCGKCRVRVLQGHLDITAEDRSVCSPQELEEGWRLACRAKPEEDVTLWIPDNQEREIQAVTAYQTQSTSRKGEVSHQAASYGLAIDIGTTTIAIQLNGPDITDVYSALNPQRAYGADVISRIQVSMEGNGKVLMDQIRSALLEGIRTLMQRNPVDWKKLTRITVAGNTTMIHLLMGYPCQGLGSAPFTPYQIGDLNVPLADWFPEASQEADVQIYPGISTFVGADIVAGICALDMTSREKPVMLIDLGTNGEMALGDRHRLLVTSVAAGPAFEGGNLICGTGSIPGAVCSAQWEDDTLSIKTIQDAPPVGICGTGAVEIAAELVKAEIIDETGRMEEPWFTEGYLVAQNSKGSDIRLYQKDIRELQLAKAAVRAGIETLLVKYGITANEVDAIYVAGGFGYSLDFEKAQAIGMFPEEFSGKIHAVGNSSLKGAALLLEHPEKMEEAREAAAMAKEVSLSNDKGFQEAYMESMFF